MKVRSVTLGLALLLSASPALAQTPYASVPIRSVAMRNTGIVFTSVAIANILVGAVMFGIGGGDDAFNLLGGVFVAAGGGCAAVGIPLWVVGARPAYSAWAPLPLDPVGTARLSLPEPRVSKLTFAF